MRNTKHTNKKIQIQTFKNTEVTSKYISSFHVGQHSKLWFLKWGCRHLKGVLRQSFFQWPQCVVSENWTPKGSPILQHEIKMSNGNIEIWARPVSNAFASKSEFVLRRPRSTITKRVKRYKNWMRVNFSVVVKHTSTATRSWIRHCYFC